MSDYIEDLRATVERTAAVLLTVNDDRAARRPAPGKWLAKEIVGHLVDSAANNHQRFVRAQLQDDLIFPGYAQDDLVAVQRYQDASWTDLVTLWRAYNQHIARVLQGTP